MQPCSFRLRQVALWSGVGPGATYSSYHQLRAYKELVYQLWRAGDLHVVCEDELSDYLEIVFGTKHKVYGIPHLFHDGSSAELAISLSDSDSSAVMNAAPARTPSLNTKPNNEPNDEPNDEADKPIEPVEKDDFVRDWLRATEKAVGKTIDEKTTAHHILSDDESEGPDHKRPRLQSHESEGSSSHESEGSSSHGSESSSSDHHCARDHRCKRCRAYGILCMPITYEGKGTQVINCASCFSNEAECSFEGNGVEFAESEDVKKPTPWANDKSYKGFKSATCRRAFLWLVDKMAKDRYGADWKKGAIETYDMVAEGAEGLVGDCYIDVEKDEFIFDMNN